MATLRYGVELRAAAPADGPELARLLAQAGWHVSPADAAGRLDQMRQSGAVLVATGWQGLAGLAALHWAPTLQAPRPVAALTALVVDADERRHGIGRMLLKAASQAARAAGCDTLDAILPDTQPGGRDFLLASGFIPSGQGMTRSLRRQGRA